MQTFFWLLGRNLTHPIFARKTLHTLKKRISDRKILIALGKKQPFSSGEKNEGSNVALETMALFKELLQAPKEFPHSRKPSQRLAT